jgi:mono/diheme cytochrome c family protein
MKFSISLAFTAALVGPCLSLAAQEIPPAATTKVEFLRDIKPILNSACVSCHTEGKAKGKLRLDVKSEALKGGSEGPAMIAGKSADSLLIQLVAGTHPDFDRMPPKGDPLTPEQIGLLRAWIDQGIEWPDDATPAAAPAPALTHPTTAPFEGLGPGWQVAATDQKGPLATWALATDIPATEAGPSVTVTPTAPTDPNTFNLLLNPSNTFKNGVLEVKLKAIGGVDDQGGGIVWRAKDNNNYYLARYNPLEKNLRVYKVVEGKREQLGTLDVEVPAGEWAALRIESRDDTSTASLNGHSLPITDTTFPEAGGVGYWTKADAATAFSPLTVAAQ